MSEHSESVGAHLPAPLVFAGLFAVGLGLNGVLPYEVIAHNVLPMVARLVTFAGVAPGQRVLDVACGTGAAAISARLTRAEVVGLD